MTSKSNANRHYYGRSYFAVLIVLAAILSSRATYGFDPNVEGDFEPVDQYRRRMGIEYGYKTRLLSPELCRDYSERECEDMEDSFIQQATNLRKLKNTPNGDVNVVVLLIRFSDHNNRNLPTSSEVDVLFNDPGTTGDTTPTGSIKTFLAKNSYDEFRINAVVSADWVDAGGSEASCAGTTKGVNNQFMNCFAPALEELENSRAVSWWDFDLDGDGSLDAVIVLHSGYASSQGQTDEDGVDSSKRIQSHARSAPPSPWESRSTGIRLGNHVIVSVYRGIADQKISRLNIISHETIHLLGAIDIYDTSFKTYGVGGYALMAYPYGHTGTLAGATTPGHVSPWVKMEVGWLTPIEITQDGTYLARPSFTTRDIYKISAPYPDGEYLLIENRPAIGWDTALGGGGGIVIWSVDENINGNTGAGLEVVVLQADGNFDLENNNNFGDEGDFWVTGRELEATGAVSTKSRRTGASNGIRIYNFSPPGTEESFFTVENLAPAAQTPAPVPAPTVAPTIPVTAAPSTQEPTAAPIPVTTAPPTQEPTPIPVTTAPSTQEPTNAPTQTITAAPTAARILVCPSDQCCITAGLEKCDALLAATRFQPDCGCANFCGGVFVGCCNKGEMCLVTCAVELIAGCTREAPSSPPSETPTISPTNIPTSTPTQAPTRPLPITPLPTLPPTNLPITASPTQATSVPTLAPTNLRTTATPTQATSVPTLAPTNFPTTATPTQEPVAGCVNEREQTCLVSVGTYQCSSLVATQTPVKDCDCYNYCNGEFLGCSMYGEFSDIACQGSLAAGCEGAEGELPEPEPECLLAVSTDECGPFLEEQETPTEDCDCYNFCDGEFLGCCGYGEFCGLSCPSGSLVAGCQLGLDATPTPATTAPTKAPTPKQSFFFWK